MKSFSKFILGCVFSVLLFADLNAQIDPAGGPGDGLALAELYELFSANSDCLDGTLVTDFATVADLLSYVSVNCDFPLGGGGWPEDSMDWVPGGWPDGDPTVGWPSDSIDWFPGGWPGDSTGLGGGWPDDSTD